MGQSRDDIGIGFAIEAVINISADGVPIKTEILLLVIKYGVLLDNGAGISFACVEFLAHERIVGTRNTPSETSQGDGFFVGHEIHSLLLVCRARLNGNAIFCCS